MKRSCVPMLAILAFAMMTADAAAQAAGHATVPIPGAHERPFDPVELAARAQKLSFRAEASTDVEAALRHLRATEHGPLRILICGSLYLAGRVLALQDGVEPQMN